MIKRKPTFVMLSLAAFGSSMASAAVEEVIVTAQKRDENIQTVPLAISAITDQALLSSGVNTTADIPMAVPGITVTTQSTAVMFYIRGIGTVGGQAGQESAIASFVDGVYQPSLTGAMLTLNNIERIEVLKGPQGTIYGRNATGGAINVITKTPSYQPHLKVEVGYGNLDTSSANIYATSGLFDHVAGDIAVVYSHQGEGFGKNVTTGKDANKQDKDFASRGKLLIEPTDATRIIVSGDYSESHGSMGMSFRPIPSTSAILTGVKGNPYGYYDTQGDVQPYMQIRSSGGSAHIEHDFGFAQFVSITAYRKLDNFQDGDLDAGPMPLIEFPLAEKNHQFTQEFQLNGDTGDISWISGLYYLRANSKYDPYNLFGMGIAQGYGHYGLSQKTSQDTESLAAYGQATFEVADYTNLTLGARYTHDKRELSSRGYFYEQNGSVTAMPDVNDDSTFNKPTWRIALDHQFTGDLMAYVSYSRGFKSGVYNLTSPYDPVVKPETLDAYEIGAKSQLFDHRLQLNAAAFYYKYNDIQLTTIQGASQILVNAAKATVYGLGVDLNGAITDTLSLRGGFEALHGRYDSFPDAPIVSPNPVFPYGNMTVDCAANPQGCDAKGNRMINTPNFTANLALDARVPVSFGELNANISYAYNSGFYFNADNRVKQDAYGLVNAQIGWTSPQDTYNVRLWARNLTDKQYLQFVSEAPTGDLGSPGMGRTYGVTVGMNY
jgi:iron complex outermembrane receptor protein